MIECMMNNQQGTIGCKSQSNPSVFISTVFMIIDGQCSGVFKYRRIKLEANLMLHLICFCFRRIPLKIIMQNLSPCMVHHVIYSKIGNSVDLVTRLFFYLFQYKDQSPIMLRASCGLQISLSTIPANFTNRSTSIKLVACFCFLASINMLSSNPTRT